MKRKLSKKTQAAVALGAAAVVAVGGTFAWFSTTDQVENVFDMDDFDVSITEAFDPETPMNPGSTITKQVGVTNYGATRWIGFGGLTVQPSEVAKYAFVIFAAAHFSKYADKVKTFRGVLPVLGVGIGFCVLIIAEPNMSITMCVGLLMLAMVFMCGTNLRTFALILLPFVLAVPLLIVLEPYRLQRLSAFLDPWASPKDEGYQLIQSLYALGNGGMFGVGLFNSTQKYRFLPFAESDFIMSVMGEELGFFGLAIFFAVCIFIVFRGLKIARNARTRFGFLLSAGITLVYGIQVVINALVVSGTIPPTGLPLPLISSGNTSLIITMASMGVLYSVSRSN